MELGYEVVVILLALYSGVSFIWLQKAEARLKKLEGKTRKEMG